MSNESGTQIESDTMSHESGTNMSHESGTKPKPKLSQESRIVNMSYESLLVDFTILVLSFLVGIAAK